MENEQFEKVEIFDTPEQLAASMQADAQTTTTEEAPQQESQPVSEQPVQEQPPVEAQPEQQEVQQEVQPEPQVEQQQETTVQPERVEQPQYSQDQIEGAVLEYMSERLGRDITSMDDLVNTPQGQSPLDGRVAAIAEFVEKTGRNPEDWFRYQSLNPSEMDDFTAVKVDMASKYPNLSAQEVNLLIKNNYKFDAEKDGEEQVQLSQLQLKIDAETARKNISEIREKYAAPEIQQEQSQSFINDQWVSQMSKEVDQLTGLEFDLGNDKVFTFGLDETYRSDLKDKNAKLDEFFLDFVDQSGNWDFDALSSHRAVVDNIDKIVSAAYKQGVGDGQKGLVEKAANVSTASPQQGTNSTQTQSPLAQQVKDIMNQNSTKMTFKI
tara:strand:+ start:2769 stop:3908 length:1140 start_codon:yes stop_codon:yes gene_type:complete